MARKQRVIWGAPPFISYANFKYKSPEVEKQRKVFERLIKRNDFQDMVIKIRLKRNVDPRQTVANRRLLGEIERLQEKKSSGGKIKELHKKFKAYYDRVKPIDIIPILEKFKLSYLWFGVIRRYIFMNKVEHLIEIKCEPFLITDIYNRSRIFIEIFPDTTLKDIYKAWDRVLFLQKEFPEYYRKNIRKSKLEEEHNKIVELYSMGKTTKEIYQIIEREYPDYMVEPEALRKIKERKIKKAVQV